MTREDMNLFIPSVRLQKKVDKFLDARGIPRNTNGRLFITDYIVYQTNKMIYSKMANKKVYMLIAEKNNTTADNVVRLVRYASYESNKKKPIYPIQLFYEAWYEIKLGEEKKDYENITARCPYIQRRKKSNF